MNLIDAMWKTRLNHTKDQWISLLANEISGLKSVLLEKETITITEYIKRI